MRFLFHAINSVSENNLNNLRRSKKKLYFMAEFRSDKDPLMKKGKKISFNERFTDHYRRFINFGKFIDTLKKEL